VSIRIIKQGIADSIQDTGRYGYQYLGINPGGAMDTIAAQTANLLVGNQLTDAVVELHYPSSGLLFEKEALFAISGADLGATINNVPIPVNRPVIIEQYSVLQFKKPVSGVRAYLAVKDGFDIMKWMNGYGTNLTAKAGGYKGRYLQKDDALNFRFTENYTTLLKGKDYLLLPWKVDVKSFYSTHIRIRMIPGNEYDWLTDESKQRLQASSFTITSQSNRMGYRMKGENLFLHCQQQLLSTGVTKGTIQLLPNGQLVILMADHPTYHQRRLS
jgi:antagonist of KipI